MQSIQLKSFVVPGFFVLALLTGIASQHALSHTVIQPPEVVEGVQSENNLVITHGCGETSVIGTSVVFPDGIDSTITINGNPSTEPLDSILQNWGGVIRFYQDRSLFSEQDSKRDSLGNAVGFWSGGGRSLSSHLFGRIPFQTAAVLFQADSCATSVRFSAAVADICKITPLDQVNEEATVNFWTPAVGSNYDGSPGGHAYDFPVFFTVKRNLETNPLPETCGTGVQISVKPSAAQINRDMPIIYNGTQVWPQP